MDKLIIRQARPQDSEEAARLIYSTSPEGFYYNYVVEKEEALQLIKILFKNDKGVFSYKFTTTAELNGMIAGLEIGYSPKEKKHQLLYNYFYIFKNFKLDKIIKILYRRYLKKKFRTNIDKGSYYINYIAVMPEFRGKGIGGKLLENAFQKAQLKKYKKVYIDVSILNTNAVNLYKKLGFEILEEVKNITLEKKYNLHELGTYRMVKRME